MHPTNHSPPILVLSRKKPHLIFIQLLVVLSGISAFLGDAAEGVPSWLTHAWGVALLFTGAASLISHLQRLDRERGMYVERGALSLQSGVVLLYAGAITAYASHDALLVIAMLTAISWSASNMWEVKLISNDLKMINAMRAITPNPEPEMKDAT